ncbi:MAG: sugar phosphate isomerase/epimerase [Eubacteriales bacterium]|nr:sugar phosphate isomerase/epimerase [Eubacteriales bacterium]
MYKIGLSSCGKVLNEELFYNYSKSGLSSIEISPDPSEYKNLDYKSLAKFSRKHNVELWSYHLPFAPFEEIEPSSLDIELRAKTIGYFTDLINKASDIGINKFIIHPSGEPNDEIIREEKIKCAKDSLNKLVEIAAQHNSIICVENLPRSCLGNSSSEINALISVHDKLRVCFDTNHLLGESNVEFIKNVGDKIVTLHVSDYDFINERHWLPGEGKINWNDILDALKKAKYNGVWMYEVGLKCPKTIIRSRDLNCGDFAANAKALFDGKTPAIFSTPKSNLGIW